MLYCCQEIMPGDIVGATGDGRPWAEAVAFSLNDADDPFWPPRPPSNREGSKIADHLLMQKILFGSIRSVSSGVVEGPVHASFGCSIPSHSRGLADRPLGNVPWLAAR